MPASFSSDLSPVPSTPSPGYTQRRPSTPEEGAPSADIFMMPRAQHSEQYTDAPQEGQPRACPTLQGGNPNETRGPGFSGNLTERTAAMAGGLDDPFKSEGTGLTRNLARRLDDGVVVLAATIMDKSDCEVGTDRRVTSPTPAGQPRARTEIRKRRLASQAQGDDQTTQMIGKIFRAIYRLEDKVERMASDMAFVKQQTEYTGSRVRYEFGTDSEVPTGHSGDGNPQAPLRGEVDHLREEVQTILRCQGKALGELQASLRESRDLVDRVENRIETAIGAAIQNAKNASTQEENRGKGRAPAHRPLSDDGMDWEEVVAETERLERAEQVTRNTAYQNPPAGDPSAANCAAPDTGTRSALKGKKAVSVAVPPTGTKRPTQKPAPPPPPATPKALGPRPKPQPTVVSYASAAKAAPQRPTEWTTVQRGGKSRGTRPQHQRAEAQAPKPVAGLDLDQRKFVLVTDPQASSLRDNKEYIMADVMSAVNRALHQEGAPIYVRMYQLRKNARGTLAGLSTPSAPIEQLLLFRDTVIRAARTVEPAVVDITANETWRRVKIHGVSLNRYLGRGTHGLEKLREEIVAENEGVEVPMQIRWLGRVPDIKERVVADGIRGSSVTFVVRGQLMADKIIKRGVRAAGRHYQVEAFIEVRPDSICGACSGWGHGEHSCASPTAPRCALCAGEHRTVDHKCTVNECKAPRGSVCIHLIARCPNCKGPHSARSDQCPKKKEAQQKATGWKGRESVAQGPAPTPPPPTPQLEGHPGSGTPCGRCQGNLRPGQICLECEREGVPEASMHACQVQPQTSHKEPCRCTTAPLPPFATTPGSHPSSSPFSGEDIEKQRASMEQLIREAQAAETTETTNDRMLTSEHQGPQGYH